jgi:beta-1,4-mannooligosaccharide/beta-1,4-mannosyl-N-acetylglucosamine phosphorylase
MPKMLPELKSSSVIKRYQNGKPVLAKGDIPYAANCVFNAGVAKVDEKYVMIFRNDHIPNEDLSGFKACNLGIAYSEDGYTWKAEPKPFLVLEDMKDSEITRVYDPRLTMIEGVCYMCFAVDTKHGLRGGIGLTRDFKSMEVISMSLPDNRNMVLFPEKINGMYVRLERPMPVYSRGKDRFDMWMSYSPDLKYWGDSKLLLAVEDVHYANDKVGPAAPPIKTKAGWLTIFHAVDRDSTRGKHGWEKTWQKRYSAGIMLLDLEDPSKVLGIYEEPLMASETVEEVEEGFRTNVIFPCGMIMEDNGEVKIYYGASDTVVCLATAQVNDLIALCLKK